MENCDKKPGRFLPSLISDKASDIVDKLGLSADKNGDSGLKDLQFKDCLIAVPESTSIELDDQDPATIMIARILKERLDFGSVMEEWQKTRAGTIFILLYVKKSSTACYVDCGVVHRILLKPLG